VVVVGEFKKGKSSLVNALVNAEVCPADPVYATVTPIAVSHGDELTVTLTRRRGQQTEQANIADIAGIASEDGNEGNHLGVTGVDITLPRRLLASGLCLVDTPGVGGLDSGVGAMTLATLETASGVLFTTDCSQELTAPEIEYLTAARQRCANVLCVMTKRDLYLHAGDLVERNRTHLVAAGIDDVEIFAVSSVLHLLALANHDVALEAESGFSALFTALRQRVWEPARRAGLADAGHQLAAVADHLAIPIEAEREARRSVESAERVITQLDESRRRVQQFTAANARWQQRLAEGMQDVSNDLDHDLRTRIRQLNQMADGRIDSDVAAEDLTYETWLHKAAMEEVIKHYESIVDRVSALADETAERFATFDQRAGFRVEGPVPADLLAAVHVTREQNLVKDGIIRRVITTGQGYSSGMIISSSVLGLLAPAFLWVSVIALPIAGFMARRAFVDDRARRRMARRQELKRLTTRYLDEIGFVVHKDSRDTMRRLQREIRGHYTERAVQLERTLKQALAAAEQARNDGAEGTESQGAESVADNAGLVREIRRSADRLIAVAPIAS
jgi:tRNA U34 5-carboxymethylaminomethyl modifying GTPase MnmE/TrmE